MRLVWHYVFRNQTRTSTRTPEQLTELREKTSRLIDRIRAAKQFEPVPSKLCSWCEFNDICPEFASSARDRGPEGDRGDPAANPGQDFPPHPG